MKLYFVEVIKPASSQIFSLEIKKLVPGYFRSASFLTPCTKTVFKTSFNKVNMALHIGHFITIGVPN